MRTRKATILAAVMLVLCAITIDFSTPAQAKATSEKVNLKVPVEPFSWFVPCALDGDGEWVHFTGTLHIVQHVTIDDQGMIHFMLHFNPQGVVGVGGTSGATYRGTGCTRYNEKYDPSGAPYSYKYIDNFGVIGQGLSAKLHLKTTTHVETDADGNVTVLVDKMEVSCK